MGRNFDRHLTTTLWMTDELAVVAHADALVLAIDGECTEDAAARLAAILSAMIEQCGRDRVEEEIVVVHLGVACTHDLGRWDQCDAFVVDDAGWSEVRAGLERVAMC